jgi:hypothetical protein
VDLEHLQLLEAEQAAPKVQYQRQTSTVLMALAAVAVAVETTTLAALQELVTVVLE